MKLEARIEKLEQAMAGEGEQHEDRAGFRDHVMYAVMEGGRVLSVPDLEFHQDERAFHGEFSQGTKFLRLGAGGTHEVGDGASRPVRFKPLAPMEVVL
ncbi:hypothetical protein [Desulfomicrobium salsuginis]